MRVKIGLILHDYLRAREGVSSLKNTQRITCGREASNMFVVVVVGRPRYLNASCDMTLTYCDATLTYR